MKEHTREEGWAGFVDKKNAFQTLILPKKICYFFKTNQASKGEEDIYDGE